MTRAVQVGLTLVLGSSLPILAAPANEAPVRVPRAAVPRIDGRIDGAEWKGSAEQRLDDGTAIRLRHDSRHLFLGVTGPKPGFASVCVAAGGSVRILHASAALGQVEYARAGDSWTTSAKEFVYAMRDTELTEPARRERAAYLVRHGWVASTYGMGGGRSQELQLALDPEGGPPRVALGFFVPAGGGGSVVAWPAIMSAADGCRQADLVRGFVPQRLRFEPERWVGLELVR